MTQKTKRRNTSPADPVSKYALAVVNKKIIAGEHVINCCRRHLLDLEEGHKRGLTFNLAASQRILDFFPDVLRLNAGEHEGLPFHLLPWQQFIVGSLFGWIGPNGYRRFNMGFVLTGKGSGKSPLAAGIGLYMEVADNEPRAEVYAAATKKDQARVLFRDAIAMVEQSPGLSERLLLSGGLEKHNIADLPSGSFFRPISSEARGKGQSGPRPHCALLDEVHEHPTNAMVEFMRAGVKGRRQPLILMITNAGTDRESVCYEYWDYSNKVNAGKRKDDAFFGYVCGLDYNPTTKKYEDPFKNKKCWPKANPSLGITFTEKYLADQVTQARGIPSKQNLVLRLNFCRWTDSVEAWIEHEKWAACERDIDMLQFRGRECYGGLDLSGKLDLTALALVFPNDDGTFDAFVEFWTPADTMRAREETDRVEYSLWRDQGYLTATPGGSIDYGFVALRMAELTAEYDIKLVAFDRYRVADLQRELDAQGVELEMVEYGQGFKDMTPALEALEGVITNNKLRVQDNPVLRWNVASAVVDENAAGDRKFNKRKATGRIDGIQALAMAQRLASGATINQDDFNEFLRNPIRA